ncbi:helix-turn-helix domain-containing protein [Liquorilactobacillus uvarum]
MLSLTNKSISEIAYEVGYTDTTSLVRAFKLAEGITPKPFRKNNLL